MWFAEAARALAGQAGLLLNWRPQDFWAATPEDLAIALDALRSGEGVSDAADMATVARLKEQFPDG
ncbi:MAG: phage tail assembly chaperone [Sphingopyxis sp.]